jgi:hypothetical protein
MTTQEKVETIKEQKKMHRQFNRPRIPKMSPPERISYNFILEEYSVLLKYYKQKLKEEQKDVPN